MYHTNMKSIESQLILMRKFVHDQQIHALQRSEKFSLDTSIDTIFKETLTKDILSFSNLNGSDEVLRHLHSTTCSLDELHAILCSGKDMCFRAVPPFSQKVFDNADITLLKKGI